MLGMVYQEPFLSYVEQINLLKNRFATIVYISYCLW